MKTQNRNLQLLFSVAVALAIGVSFGLPMIYQKNGLGLAVVLIVSMLAVIGIVSLRASSQRSLSTEGDSKQPFRKSHLVAYGIASPFIGTLIAVGGGVVANSFAPMNPLDVYHHLWALAILGFFCGAIVGAVIAIAIRV